MTQFPLSYAPGVVADDTLLAKGGRYVDADKWRFRRTDAGQPVLPEIIGGWERLVRTALTGICRSILAWTDNAGDLNIAFGTHSKLMLWKGSALYDITPNGPPTRLGANPLTTANASATITVAQTAHGYSSGIQVEVFGAPTFNGVAAANLNGLRTITVTGPNSFTFTAGASDTASASGAGGGSEVIIVPQTELPAGQIHGTGGRGYGTGAYGVGGYGEPSDVEYFPRTWSFGLIGEALIASPRDGAIYIWENDTAQRARWVHNSPIRNASIMTTPQRVIMALGTEEEASPHTYNPKCLRHCDSRILLDDGRLGYEVWNTDTDTLAREKVLEAAGRLVCGRTAGPANLIWTDNEVFQGSYVGALDEIYRFDRLGEDCGVAGPNAACTRNQRAFWLTPDLQYMTVSLGGEPYALDCPFQKELKANLSASQRDKIVMSTLSTFREVWCWYPDARDGSGGVGLEISRALFFSLEVASGAGWWSKAQLDRTAFCDSGPADYPVGVSSSGYCYWHERGQSADGNAISHFLRAGPQYIDAGRLGVFVREFWPDFTDQQGALNLTVYVREFPQSPDEAFGPFVMTADTEKVEPMVEGRIISWQIAGTSGPVSCRMGTPIVEGRGGRRAK